MDSRRGGWVQWSCFGVPSEHCMQLDDSPCEVVWICRHSPLLVWIFASSLFRHVHLITALLYTVNHLVRPSKRHLERDPQDVEVLDKAYTPPLKTVDQLTHWIWLQQSRIMGVELPYAAEAETSLTYEELDVSGPLRLSGLVSAGWVEEEGWDGVERVLLLRLLEGVSILQLDGSLSHHRCTPLPFLLV